MNVRHTHTFNSLAHFLRSPYFRNLNVTNQTRTSLYQRNHVISWSCYKARYRKQSVDNRTAIQHKESPCNPLSMPNPNNNRLNVFSCFCYLYIIIIITDNCTHFFSSWFLCWMKLAPGCLSGPLMTNDLISSILAVVT